MLCAEGGYTEISAEWKVGKADVHEESIDEKNKRLLRTPYGVVNIADITST